MGSDQLIQSRSVFYNLWFVTTLRIEWPLHKGGGPKIIRNMVIYIMFYNNSKIQLGCSQENNFMIGVTTEWGIILKFHCLGRLRTTGLGGKWLEWWVIYLQRDCNIQYSIVMWGSLSQSQKDQKEHTKDRGDVQY